MVVGIKELFVVMQNTKRSLLRFKLFVTSTMSSIELTVNCCNYPGIR